MDTTLRRSPRILSALLGATLLLTATPALAYLTPSQVFGGSAVEGSSSSDATVAYPPPPSQRQAEQQVSNQQQYDYVQRKIQQQSLFSSSSSGVTILPQSSAEPLGLFDPNKQYDLRMQRRQQEGITSTAIDSTLHSGAPNVTSTGTGTTLALALLVLAGLSTIGVSWLPKKYLGWLIG